MTRVAKNPGTGKPPHNGPAMGGGSGDWASGPAHGVREAFAHGNAAGPGGRGDVNVDRLARGARMEARMEEIAMQSENLNAAARAAKDLAERDLGGVVQRVVSATIDGAVNLTDDQRRAVLGTLRKCLIAPDVDL